MLQRAIAVTILAFVTGFTATPAWALAFCPVVRTQVEHPCCPSHHKPPAPLCSAHCRSLPSAPPQIFSLVLPPGTQADLTVLVPVQVAEPDALTAMFDSSDLWLRDRVLRI